jgi:hypothetical protein
VLLTLGAPIAAVLLLAAGCSGAAKPASAPTTSTTTPSGPVPWSPTTTVIQTSGIRTVLSPIGINLRAQPSATAAIVGTAAQGATLTVLGHTGGFYQVMGATVASGYITDNPADTAAGKFVAYGTTGGGFAALYPAGWTATGAAPASVVFSPPSGHDSIVITTATAVSALGNAQSGYQQDTSTTEVVCGFTGQLVTYTQAHGAAPTLPPTPGASVVSERYLVQIDLTLDAQHAVGVVANLASLDQLASVEDVINSLSFPFPQCQGGAAGPTATTVTPTTVF